MPGQRLLLSCVPALMLVVACSHPSNQAAPAPTPYSQTTSGNQSARRVNAIADDYWAAWVQTFPLAALFSGVPNAPNDRIGDNSIAAVRAWERREDQWLDQLQQVRASDLKEKPEDATYGVLMETMEDSRKGPNCLIDVWSTNKHHGRLIGVPIL